MTWSPVFRCGVYIGLCLPRSTFATLAASRPNVWPLASTMYQLAVISDGLALYVFPGSGISLVLHRNLHQPLRRGKAQTNCRALEQRVDPLQRPATATHVHQRAGDPAHHAVQERVRRDGDRDPVTGAAHRDLVDMPNGVAAWPRAAPERPEVMAAGQPVGGRLHSGNVERVAKPPGVLTLVGAARELLADPVRVEPRPR